MRRAQSRFSELWAWAESERYKDGAGSAFQVAAGATAPTLLSLSEEEKENRRA